MSRMLKVNHFIPPLVFKMRIYRSLCSRYYLSTPSKNILYTPVVYSHFQFQYPPLLCSESPGSLYSGNFVKKETSLCLCPHLLQRGEEIRGGWSSLWVVGQTLPHHTKQRVLSSTHQTPLQLGGVHTATLKF